MKLLEQGVAERAFPGGVLAVGHRGRLAVHACGKLSHAAGAAKVDAETIYDTASLTKPVVTTTLAAMLYEQGQLDISAPVGRYLPEWTRGANAEQRARVTVAHLLAHASGLPAHEDYFLKSKGRSGDSCTRGRATADLRARLKNDLLRYWIYPARSHHRESHGPWPR